MGLEDFQRRISQTLEQTRNEAFALSSRGLPKEAIKVINLGAKSLRAIKSEIMLAEREIRAAASEHRRDIAGKGQLLGAFMGSRARGVLARGRQADRRQLARNQAKALGPYEHLRNEILRNLAVLERLKVELSRTTPSTNGLSGPANSTTNQFEHPVASQPYGLPAAWNPIANGFEHPVSPQPYVPLPHASSHSNVSQRPSGSVARTLKVVALAVAGLFVLLIVLGAAVANKKGKTAKTIEPAVPPTPVVAKVKPLNEMLDVLNSSMSGSAAWTKAPPDAVARCRPACRNINAIYKSTLYQSKIDLCMKLCSSAENSSQIVCMTRATTKAQADKCPDFVTRPVKLVVGAQPDVVVLDTVFDCDLKLLKELVGGDNGLGQAFAPYKIRQLVCPDGTTALNLTYDK